MNNSTPGNLLTTSSKNSSSSSELSEENLQELHLSDDETAPVKQVIDELDTIRYSPRAATIKAILQYSQKKKETVQ